MIRTFIAGFFFLIGAVGYAQKSGADTNQPGVLTDAALQMRAFKAAQPSADKTESWEVVGLGQTTYTASNVMDGSTNSYQHTMRIVVGLTTPMNRSGSCQLVFYGEGDRIQQAATIENGVLSIYYPLEVYESLRSRLEQSLSARKKMMVKVTVKTDGYREGVLVF